MTHHIGYKKCKGDRIVKLRIEGINNEGRNGIVSARHAKYRCSQATVISITSWNRKYKYKRATNLGVFFAKPLVYKVGETITIDDYDTDLDKVYSNGIHYFLDRQTAVWYWNTPKGYTGLREQYRKNGQLFVKGEYRDGYIVVNKTKN